MISLTSKGNFDNVDRFLKKCLSRNYISVLEHYGQEGMQALSAATPVDSGLTASSWDYEIVEGKDSITINWYNSNVNNGVNIAVILQYGHATRNGGYVAGTDYMTPALKPIFDNIADAAWKEVIGS